jgi:hypothetical protein
MVGASGTESASRAPTVANLCCGFLAIPRATTASNRGEMTCGRARLGFGGSAVKWALMIWPTVVADGKGLSPLSISVSTQASEYTSARLISGSLSKRSGAMYA